MYWTTFVTQRRFQHSSPVPEWHKVAIVRTLSAAKLFHLLKIPESWVIHITTDCRHRTQQSTTLLAADVKFTDKETSSWGHSTQFIHLKDSFIWTNCLWMTQHCPSHALGVLGRRASAEGCIVSVWPEQELGLHCRQSVRPVAGDCWTPAGLTYITDSVHYFYGQYFRSHWISYLLFTKDVGLWACTEVVCRWV